VRILMSGTSGMVGSVVAPYLASQGHEVVRLVRREPAKGELRWDPDAGTIDAAAVEGFDGVVHVASRHWPMRWTTKAKALMRDNRLRTNGLLSETLARCRRKPRVLVCASGMGIYPSSGDQVLTEDSAPGTDFLARLQRDGEAATAPAGAAGIRVVNLRIPPVLGGAAVRRNVGRAGDGRQWSSWVSRDELANIIHHVLVTDALPGPVNPVSPNPVRNAELAATQSRVLGTRPGMPMPAFLLRLMLGEMAEALMLASGGLSRAGWLRPATSSASRCWRTRCVTNSARQPEQR
jgi:uncharacterized protein (TIGR01777 family)